MDHSAKQIKKYLHRSLAGVMAVWLSGVVFLLCCQTTAAAMPDGDSCPMAKMSSHCDKMKQQNADSAVFEAPPVNCLNCGFLPVVFDKTRKIEPEGFHSKQNPDPRQRPFDEEEPDPRYR